MPIEQKEAEIVFTVDARGGFEVEVNNVQGPQCEALSKPYLDMFPGSRELRKKEEFHQQQQQHRKQQKL